MTTTDTDLTQLVINVGTTAQIEAGISGGTITNDMLSMTTDGGNYLTSSDVTSSYSATGTAPVNGTAVASALGTLSIPTDTSDLTNGAGYITGITSSDVTTALGYTPYNSSNPNGYTSNVGTVTSVNNVSPVNGNVSITIPSEVTETTVSNWGFTKNTGTVTSVNNVSPVSGNVTLSIPTDTNDLTNGAGYITSSALSGYLTTSDIVSSVDSSSTNSKAVGAKLFYDTCGDIETLINAL